MLPKLSVLGGRLFLWRMLEKTATRNKAFWELSGGARWRQLIGVLSMDPGVKPPIMPTTQWYRCLFGMHRLTHIGSVGGSRRKWSGNTPPVAEKRMCYFHGAIQSQTMLISPPAISGKGYFQIETQSWTGMRERHQCDHLIQIAWAYTK